MKRIKNFKRNPLAHWVACALAVVSVAGVVQAAPLAGTEIKNLATVSYEDENGNKYTAQSNEAVITVAEQYKATIENDRTQDAAPGQTAYFSHTIVNTGNTADTYTLSVDNSAKIYLDKNNNGQPDPGENEITTGAKAGLSLTAGEIANVIVAYAVPIGAADNSSTTLTLTAASDAPAPNTGVVIDLAETAVGGAGSTGGADTTEGTSTDIVNVTTGAVLVLNKSSVIDTVAKTITYTLTVKNTGRSDAVGVDILDTLPFVDTNNDGTKDTQTTLVAKSIVTTGLLDNTDVQGGDTTEAVLTWDVNANGLIDGVVIKATDDRLPAGTTISVSYKVNYLDSWAASAEIDNTFIAFEDPDKDDKPRIDPITTLPIIPPTSNTTHDDVPQNYAVIADDDNNVHVDTEVVDTIAAGDTVVFSHTITNNGNGDDIFNLTMKNTDFPKGTVFTLWNANGTVQLTDSDSDGIPDTGVLGQGLVRTIVVKADLPANKSGTPVTGYNAVLTATSSADSTKNDPTNLKLGSITAPAVDLAAAKNGVNAVAIDGGGVGQVITGFNDDGSIDAHDEEPVMLEKVNVGGAVEFPLSVANESGSADSFMLSASNIPTGWGVTFKDTSGNTIASTPFLPAKGTFDYVAVVTVSSDASQALGDSDRRSDVDGYDAVDGGVDLVDNDGDNDYVITFKVESSNDSTKFDELSNAIDVNEIKAVTITPDGQNQIQPGGTVEYPHVLKNDGNIRETLELKPVINSDPDWSSTTLVEKMVAGVVTLVEYTTLVAGDKVKVYKPDGSSIEVSLVDADLDGKVEFPLEPSQYVKLINKVFSPANAPQGETNTTTLSVTNPDATLRSTAKDNSKVILGQVRLTKKVAADIDCNNEHEGTFAEIQTTKIEPGQCAIWEIFAKNEGGAKVKNVIITDIVPTFTTFLDGSLQIDGVIQTKAIDSMVNGVIDRAEVSATGVITYYLGTGANDAAEAGVGKGGYLLSGASSTVRFTVKVDE